MDQTLSIPQTVADCRSAVISPSAAATADEEPESPGRSPGGSPAASPLSDPLSDGLALLAGVAIGLIAVVVPLITVVCETRPLEAVRAAERVNP